MSTESKDADTNKKPGDRHSISNFESSSTLSPGFLAKSDRNFKQLLSKRLQKSLDFGLCKPAIWKDFAVVGTDVVDSKDNFLVCFQWATMVENAVADPIVSYLPVPENVTGVHWIAEDVILASMGYGNVRLYSISADRQRLELAGIYANIHENSIREVAMCPTNGNLFASGGSDQQLKIVDLTVGTEPVHSTAVKGVIGSLRWPTLNQGACLSLTMDSGSFLLYDVRQPLTKPAMDVDFGKQDLWAHERYTDHNVMFGFGDGEIQHLDVRKLSEALHVTSDPYVEGVGNIEYNAESSSIAISGLCDFTVWKHEANTHVARVWSHSESGSDKFRASNVSMTATYANPTDILTSSSAGYVGVYLQDFGDVVPVATS